MGTQGFAHRLAAAAVAACLLIGLGGVAGATARDFVTSGDIRNGAVQPRDLSPSVRNELRGLRAQVEDLEQRVALLESEAPPVDPDECLEGPDCREGRRVAD